MKSGDETESQPAQIEGAAPRKPWQTPVVILETIESQTVASSQTGTDALATPATFS
jgi:hypothetical protein